MEEDMSSIPEDLRYTSEHEWVRDTGDAAVRIGVTAHATEAMGDVVYVSLPTVGAEVQAGDPCGELESTKSVSDIYAPVAGVVINVNTAVVDAPETINGDPYGDGWLFDVELAEGTDLDDLMDAEAYAAYVSD